MKDKALLKMIHYAKIYFVGICYKYLINMYIVSECIMNACFGTRNM